MTRISDNFIGRRIHELRVADEMTLAELSEASEGVSLSYISDIERGRTFPTLQTLERLCDGLCVTLPQFFEGSEFNLTENERELLIELRNHDMAGAVKRLGAIAKAWEYEKDTPAS